jgi:hypothetical protein
VSLTHHQQDQSSDGLRLARDMIRRVWNGLSTLTQSDVFGSRGSVLRDALWILGLVCTGLLTSAAIDPDSWITKMFGMFSVVAFSLVCGAYLYSLLRNPDTLRSETYALQKMRIERGLMGDSVSGIAVVETDVSRGQLTTAGDIVDSTGDVSRGD